MKLPIRFLKAFPAVIIYVLSFFSLNQSLFSGQEKKFNLLLVTIDTLRADQVGIYGVGKRRPRSWINWPEWESCSPEPTHVPLTLPSHCSLLTGTIPPVHGVRDNGYRFSRPNKTLAEIFKANGYVTAAFVGAFPLDSRFGLDKGFDSYDDNYGSRNLQRDGALLKEKQKK